MSTFRGMYSTMSKYIMYIYVSDWQVSVYVSVTGKEERLWPIVRLIINQ